jgi:lactate dehydrogenase-like 2-hydroxyacid dehydrogenase
MRPDLFLASSQSAALETALEARFTVHRGDPPVTTRAVVGGGSLRWTAEDMARCPALEIVAIHGVGHDGIDDAAAAARGIRITTTPDVLTDDVADLAIGLWLAVERAIVANDRAVRDGAWQVPLSRRASGRTVGIFGLGRIGQAIAARAAPFGGRILYCARSDKPGPWTRMPDIAALARESDVLILAARGGTDTAGIVDGAVLAHLGRGGVLINVARGALVDQDALVAALTAGGLAGAGLDVFADEPAVPDAFRTMPQVVLSPHQGSATREARAAMEALVLANLDAHFAGAKLPTPLV